MVGHSPSYVSDWSGARFCLAPSGEGFGIAHYVGPVEKRLVSSRGDDCPYGPRESCTIDTNRPFTAKFRFSAAGSQSERRRAPPYMM